MQELIYDFVLWITFQVSVKNKELLVDFDRAEAECKQQPKCTALCISCVCWDCGIWAMDKKIPDKLMGEVGPVLGCSLISLKYKEKG